MPRPTICLNLIVKNELQVLPRCLASIERFIDTWLIVDTGSTDGTQQLIQRHFAAKKMPGELVERPWRDFAHNRTEALRLAARMADYVWIIDADEELTYPEGFSLPVLDSDAYQILQRGRQSTTAFYRTQIVRTSLPFRYQGVLHEVILCDVSHSTSRLPADVVSVGHFDGARNQDSLAKYRADAAVLEHALEAEPDNARYAFYLAQSYRDAGQLQDAVATYERRVAMGGWIEEQWYAAYQLGVLHERLGHEALAVDAYLRAFELRPMRAEPLYELARLYRERSKFALGHLFARRALEIPRPDDILFLDESIYAWRILDEFSICAYYVGDRQEGRRVVEQLLGEGKLPKEHRARVEKNRDFLMQGSTP